MDKFSFARNILKSLKGDKIVKEQNSFAVDINNNFFVDGILNIYDFVWINNRDIDVLINKDEKKSFYNSGGMFYKPSFTEINEMMECEKSSIVTVNYNGNVVGMLSLTTDSSILENLNFEKEEYREIFSVEIKNKRILNFLDIILVKEGRGIAYDLLLKASEKFYENNFNYWFVEIYTIAGIFEDNKYRDLNHRNNSSSTLVEKVGGYIVGNLGKKKFTYGNRTIEVIRNVYAIPMEESILLMNEHIKKHQECKSHSA